ncbi:hypothetical protein D3C78_17710 [compost metagenome]
MALPQLKPGEIDLQELPGPPLLVHGEPFTHKVLGIGGFPYYMFARPDIAKKTIWWLNPETERVNKFTW